MSDWALVAGDPALVADAARRLAVRGPELALRVHERCAVLTALAPSTHTAHVEASGVFEAEAVFGIYASDPAQAPSLARSLARDEPHKAHGAYAFARWHHGRGELFAERDALGRIPILYAFDPQNSVVACGTDGALLLDALALPARANADALLIHLDALSALSDEDLLVPLRRLRAGERVRWSPGRKPRTSRHWIPRQSAELTSHAAVEAVRAMLTSVVREGADAAGAGAPVISISGGLDSTVLAAALADHVSATAGRPVAAAAMVSRELPCFDESGALALLERETPVRVERFELGPYWPLREPEFYARSALDGPHAHPGTYYEAAFYRWFHERFGTRPMWTGIGSEQAFSAGSAQALGGMLLREGPAAAAREARAFSTGSNLALGATHEALRWGEPGRGAASSRVVRWVRRAQTYATPPREGELTQWLTPPARARLTRLRTETAEQQDPSEPPAVRMQRGALNERIFRRLRRQALETRVAITSPLLDPRVWELGFRIAPEWKLRGGHDRAVLRLAAPASLPDELRWRPKRGLFTSAVERGLFRRELERVLQWFRAPRLADLGLIEPRAFRLAYERAASAVDAHWPVVYSAHSRDLWLTVSAELWLRALP